MGVTILEVITLDPGYDVRRIRVEDKFKHAYIDRYKRLGYRQAGMTTEKDGKVKYAVVTMKRNRNQPAYEELKEIEKQVDALLSSEEPAKKPCRKKKRNLHLSLHILFWLGVILVAGGLATLVSGFLLNKVALALGGWALVILGAVMMIAWSFMREQLHLRKIDIADDIEHPGFGVDELSKKIEENLRRADKLRSQGAKRLKAEARRAA